MDTTWQMRRLVMAARVVVGSGAALSLSCCGLGSTTEEAMTPHQAQTATQAASPVTESEAPADNGVADGAQEWDHRPVSSTGAEATGALETWDHRPISAEDLAASTHVRWFFGHQSVGGNVLKGVDQLYETHDLDKVPQIDVKADALLPDAGGFIAHAHVGRNGHPLEKIADFDAILRGGVASRIDAAVLKFCYADVRAGRVDIVAVFEEYRRVLSALEHDFPEVVFLHATVPLKADAAADNVLRTQMNSMIRFEYAATGRLWDIAAIESTTLAGEPVGGIHDGQPYQALHAGFTHDGGHLYTLGTEVAAAPLLELLAAAVP